MFCLQNKNRAFPSSAWGKRGLWSVPQETRFGVYRAAGGGEENSGFFVVGRLAEWDNSGNISFRRAVSLARGRRLRLLFYAFNILAQLGNRLFDFSDMRSYGS